MPAAQHILPCEPRAMRLRTMTTADIHAGMHLKDISGWNQTEHDWQRFLNASPNGCFVAEVDGRVVGTVATISYQDKFAWVGMVLVDPEHRGRGIGTYLLEQAVEFLDATKIPTIKLDATPLGKPLYEKMGFATEYEVERLILKRSFPDVPFSRDAVLKQRVANAQLEAILRLDGDYFGADRGSLLVSLDHEAPEFTLAAVQDGYVAAYMFGRKGSFADHIGPWASEDPRWSRQLLTSFLQRSSRDTVIADCLKSNSSAGHLLREHGFSYSRPLTRMYRGANRFPGNHKDLCAILGPEFG